MDIMPQNSEHVCLNANNTVVFLQDQVQLLPSLTSPPPLSSYLLSLPVPITTTYTGLLDVVTYDDDHPDVMDDCDFEVLYDDDDSDSDDDDDDDDSGLETDDRTIVERRRRAIEDRAKLTSNSGKVIINGVDLRHCRYLPSYSHNTIAFHHCAAFVCATAQLMPHETPLMQEVCCLAYQLGQYATHLCWFYPIL